MTFETNDGSVCARKSGTRRWLLAALVGIAPGTLVGDGSLAADRKRKRRRDHGERPTPTPQPCRPTSEAIARDLLPLVNAWRERDGARPLVLDALLVAAARTKSEALAHADIMSHEIGGVGWRDNIANHGYPTIDGWLGENLTMGARTADDAMAAWRGSPSHNRNLLDPKFRVMGAAIAWSAGGVPYVAQTFGDLVVSPASGC